MSKGIEKNICYMFLIITPLLLNSCATGHSLSRRFMTHHTIRFTDPLIIPSDYRVVNERDPKEVVTFALKLYGKREYRQAAKFFLDAADLVSNSSNYNEFRVVCLSAAATSLLEGGDIEDFQKVMVNVRLEMDRFQWADMKDELSVLMAISDKLQGTQPYVRVTIPHGVREIFK
ncbi:MAG: hypothetical protein AMJ42_00915 [Deltaproteobacteria bacterium DG_8]|nr:MAG: hypothetical protein AMJ42_00915 [Deltaproteobacteria bacterium DG_8]